MPFDIDERLRRPPAGLLIQLLNVRSNITAHDRSKLSSIVQTGINHDWGNYFFTLKLNIFELKNPKPKCWKTKYSLCSKVTIVWLSFAEIMTIFKGKSLEIMIMNNFGICGLWAALNSLRMTERVPMMEYVYVGLTDAAYLSDCIIVFIRQSEMTITPPCRLNQVLRLSRNT